MFLSASAEVWRNCLADVGAGVAKPGFLKALYHHSRPRKQDRRSPIQSRGFCAT
jgi:hypothetical protein